MGVEAIATLRSLEELSVPRLDLSPQTLELISICKTLRRVSVSGSRLADITPLLSLSLLH